MEEDDRTDASDPEATPSDPTDDGTAAGFDDDPTPYMSESALDATAGSSAPDDLGSTDTDSGLTAGGDGTAIPGLDEARR